MKFCAWLRKPFENRRHIVTYSFICFLCHLFEHLWERKEKYHILNRGITFRTWLIVNNRIRTEKYRVWFGGKENGTRLLFFESCARDGPFNFQLPSGLGHHSV